MFKYLLPLLTCSCLVDSEVDVRGQWLHPDPGVKILEVFMDSQDICLRFDLDGTLYVQSETEDETLDYVYEDGVYDVQYVGNVVFTQDGDTYDPQFSNTLIENGTKDVVFSPCEPFRLWW